MSKTEEWVETELQEHNNRLYGTDTALEKLLSEVADLNVKVVNLANKLEEHINEADAHNPGYMAKKKNK